MPLKSLELVGYKTFASKTTFEFADSITAIVGPNGSGKSNIADSLRWVLGEQSYSLLRGKKTVDMIFSGSEQRPRAGMASATVTFDNSDGWLPIDFSEVAITRRAYRDGQNEYLINGQRVRLRDVAELLARSGLAERTYTIIGQGLVDAALSLKAEERRKLFEEAAGIGVYRSRREDALKRLDTTRRNLERVQDILAELKPRVRSLDRQARRAQEYDQLKTDLHVLLREWYGYHWHKLQQELAAAREAARTQESALTAARSQQSGYDQQINMLREQVHQLRGRLNSWHRELSGLHNRRERVSRELAVAQERQRALDERRRAIRSQQTRLKEEVRLHEERYARANQETEALQQNVADAREENSLAQEALAARQHDRSEILQAVQQAERTLSEASSAAAAQQVRLEELKHRSESLQAAQAEQEKNLAHAEEELAEAGAVVEKARTAFEEADRSRAAADAALEEQRTKSAALQKTRDDLIERQRSQKTDISRLNARLEVLQQAEQALAGYSAGSRALLQAQKTGRLQQALGALGSRLEIAPEHETPVAAALGANLEAVLLGSDEEIDSALDLLIENQANGAVLPVSNLSAPSYFKAPDAAGCLGNLADHVRCPLELRPVVELLLGRFLLVDDRAAARRLRARLPGDVHLVTVAGEVFYADGGIAVGGRGTTGLISRTRQQREIAAQVAGLEKSMAETAENLTRLEAQVQGAQEEEAERTQAFQSARSLAEDARSAHRAAVAGLEQKTVQRNWQESQLSNQRAEIQAAQDSHARAGETHRQALEKIETTREKIQELRHRLSSLPLDELQAQATHWHTRLAVAERALEDARARSSDRSQALSDSGERLRQLEVQLQDHETEQTVVAREQEQLREEESEISAQIASARTLIDPAEKELAELEARQDSVQQTESKARQALAAAERNHAQAQITLARKQEALDSLRQRIEDDFGLVAFDYEEEVSGPNPLPLGELVESLPVVKEIPPELGDSIRKQRAQLRRMGAINPEAQKEYLEVRERFEFMTGQVEDLVQAEADILETISELDLLMEREFRKTFEEVAREFRDTFTRLFGGGGARLVLTDPDDMTNTGVDIEARLPGRRAQGLSLLSGGERSLTATALVFSLIRVSPTPFCVLDEVDAMLDEANVNRFADLLRELSERTQFIIITHNRNTVQTAETIYGITMGRDSTSQMLSLKMDEVADLV